MRLLVICFLVTVTVLCDAEYASRRKRFLSSNSWQSLPDSLLKLSDHARELTSKTLDVFLSDVVKNQGVSRRRYNLFESIFDEMAKQDRPARRRGNTERETEDGDEGGKDVVIDEPQHETDIQPHFTPFIPLSFPLDIFTPWWKGPNVCIERNEVDEPETEDKNPFSFSFEATQCIPTETSYTCTKKIRSSTVRKTIVMKYQCCHGYTRRKDIKPGCTEVKMDSVLETFRSLEATSFADLLDSSGMAEKLNSENVTIFAPTNEAIMDFEEESENNEISDVSGNPKLKKKNLPHLVGGHIVEGFANLATMENDHVMDSLNGRTTIRINKYRPSKEVVTANCVPISRKDNMATNGLVHLISNLLPMPRKTIVDTIKAAPHFSVFSKLLSESTLLDDMKDPKKTWTLFVPTDAAFEAMDKDMLQRLLSGEGCVDSVLRNHVLQGTVCSHAVSGKIYIQNYLGKPLALSKDELEPFKVNGAVVNTENVVATNGVVHFIDEVIIPHEAHNLLESLHKHDREDLLELIKAADLDSTFSNLNNVTFFAPSREALKNMPNGTLDSWRDDPEKLKTILLYHLSAPQTKSSDFRHNKQIATLAGHDIRLQLHELFPGLAVSATAQCALVLKHDNAACGAVFHSIDKVLTPPKSSILEALKNMDEHRIFRNLLADTELESKLEAATDGDKLYTVLAPTDRAFQHFTAETIDELLKNKTRAEQILKMHVLPEPICCSGVHQSLPFRHHFVRTLEGNLLVLNRHGLRHGRNTVRFGPARAVHCDVTAKNGLIHSVDRLALPDSRPLTHLFDMDFLKWL